MVPSADDVERSLRRLKTLNSTAQALLHSCENMAKEYKSAPLLSTLDSVNFLLTESGKSLETLEWDLISSPPSDEGGEPMDIAEVADLLCR